MPQKDGNAVGLLALACETVTRRIKRFQSFNPNIFEFSDGLDANSMPVSCLAGYKDTKPVSSIIPAAKPKALISAPFTQSVVSRNGISNLDTK